MWDVNAFIQVLFCKSPRHHQKKLEKRMVSCVSSLTNGLLTKCQPSEVVVASLVLVGVLVLAVVFIVVVVVAFIVVVAGADVVVGGPGEIRDCNSC